MQRLGIVGLPYPSPEQVDTQIACERTQLQPYLPFLRSLLDG